MTNDVASRQSSAVASLQNLRSGLQNVQTSLPPTMGGLLLRMLRDGAWVYGPENIEVEGGALWAINPLSIAHGFSCWTRYDQKDRKKNELLGEAMVPMTQPKPGKDSLPDYGWDWTDQVSFQLLCVSGEDKGTEVEYKTNSVGGIRAVHELIDKIMQQLDRDAGKPVPVVELLNDSYDHNTWGKTYIPIFQIKDWSPMDEMPGDEPKAETPDAPAEQDEKAQPETAAAAPARRTRRGAAKQEETKAEPQQETAGQSDSGSTDEPTPRRRRRVA